MDRGCCLRGRPMSIAPGLERLWARLGRLRRPALALAPAFALAVAGCYEVDQEIIPPQLGAPVPFIYDSSIGTKAAPPSSAPSPSATTKRFRDVGKDGDVSTGTPRALHIRDNIYALQTDYDDEPCCYIVFYRIDSESVQGVDPIGDVDALAARHGVTIEIYDLDYLDGTPNAILPFIRAHAELRYE